MEHNLAVDANELHQREKKRSNWNVTTLRIATCARTNKMGPGANSAVDGTTVATVAEDVAKCGVGSSLKKHQSRGTADFFLSVQCRLGHHRHDQHQAANTSTQLFGLSTSSCWRPGIITSIPQTLVFDFLCFFPVSKESPRDLHTFWAQMGSVKEPNTASPRGSIQGVPNHLCKAGRLLSSTVLRIARQGSISLSMVDSGLRVLNPNATHAHRPGNTGATSRVFMSSGRRKLCNGRQHGPCPFSLQP